MRIINEAIDKNRALEIVYLKENNQRNRRAILPKSLRSFERDEKKHWGVEAFCLQRQEDWVFRLEYILELQLFEEVKV
ncbi:hypothetical protein MNBD_UNCLBAC01-1323 [hydrothermal vent metagenome]|uniref:WYL domain-containing protein n=1 Tax=hydrothermal vent metagenome TaxID=652676 RepID=A0A3B1D3T0_9ZZZZ